MKKLELCVGSLNPTKIEAVNLAYNKFYKNYNINYIKTDSKVADQPIEMEAILEGAFNRAKNALVFLKKNKKDNSEIYGIGIEAGLAKISLANSNYMDFQFCVIMDENEKISLGSGIAFEYPQFVIDRIFSEKDNEIGNIMGRLANNINLKNESGAIGFLSKNIINRKDILFQAVICALLPRINEELYLRNEI
ncbi:MAG: inosine/xanthosine triphosphatase [Candidatus Lokiarchaeota archaeon]|nr:inosine/xanthosine triphosphatase [Candidatus Lokiarchaeota archaeon]